jgi:hypothetical protein
MSMKLKAILGLASLLLKNKLKKVRIQFKLSSSFTLQTKMSFAIGIVQQIMDLVVDEL